MRPRVLITRAEQQGSELAEQLRALGAETVLIPAIEIVAPTSYELLDEALTQLESYDWLLFTSANAVEAFRERVGARLSLGARPFRTAAIGPATARALRAIGIEPDIVPQIAVAESLAEVLRPFARAGVRFLLIRAEEARDVLPEALCAAGAEVTIAPAYRTVVPADSVAKLRALFAEKPPDAVTFTSSSTARNLVGLLKTAGVELPEATVRASIGPITSATLREFGLAPQVESSAAETGVLARELVAFLGYPPPPLFA